MIPETKIDDLISQRFARVRSDPIVRSTSGLDLLEDEHDDKVLEDYRILCMLFDKMSNSMVKFFIFYLVKLCKDNRIIADNKPAISYC